MATSVGGRGEEGVDIYEDGVGKVVKARGLVATSVGGGG